MSLLLSATETQSHAHLFLSLLEGLAGYGTNLGNAKVKDLLKRYDPEEMRECVINCIAGCVREEFEIDEFSKETPEAIAEDFFESYPAWSVFFVKSLSLYGFCREELNEGELRMTSADWRCWTARIDKSFEILNPVVDAELESYPVQTLKVDDGTKNGKTFLVRVAIAVAAVILAFPLIAGFASDLTQIPDYRMPVGKE